MPSSRRIPLLLAQSGKEAVDIFISRHLQAIVNLGCSGIVCYKLNRLSITLSVLSLEFWKYLPSCLLSDLVAIAALQLLTRWIIHAYARGYFLTSRQPSQHEQGSTPLLGAVSRGIFPSSSSSSKNSKHDDDYEKLHRTCSDDSLHLHVPPSSAPATPPTAHRHRGPSAYYYDGSEYDDPEEDSVALHRAVTSNDRTTSSGTLWSNARFLLAALSMAIVGLSQFFFAGLAIGAYRAGDVTVTWKDALTFESDGRSGFLIDSAIESWYCFAGAFGVIILVAMAGRWFVQVQQGLRPLYDVKDLCVHAWTLRVLLTVYILSALAFRPPPVLPSSDLLFDALSAVGFLSATKVGLIRIPEVVIRADTTLYGKSNIFEPRVTPLDEIRHVFIVSMESADEMAWPYTPEYCKQRNCEDIAPEYNTPHHMTPFFQSLIDKEENTFYTSQYKASIAYTSKSHFSMACGQLPEFEALIKNELQVDPPLPCLPDLLRVMDPAFKSAHWASQSYVWDHYGEFVQKAGYDIVFGRDDMEALWNRQGVKWPAPANWFGYGEDAALPSLMDWVDERLNNSERVFAVVPGNVMHHSFGLPKDVEAEQYIEYTKRSHDVSRYLNAVRWTDGYLRLFFSELEKRGLLDNSLVFVVGDHGPRLDRHGAYHTSTGHWDSGIFSVPLLLHAPGLRAIKQPRQPFVNSDLATTILDGLGVDPTLVAKYAGHSILRSRGREYDRDTYHAQNPGDGYRQVARKTARQHYKAIYFDDAQDTCATDLAVDPNEELFYCVKEGWRKANINNKLVDGLTLGLWQEGSAEETALIDFAHEAEDLLQQHFAVNAQAWDPSRQEEHLKSRAEFFESLSASSRSSASS